MGAAEAAACAPGSAAALAAAQAAVAALEGFGGGHLALHALVAVRHDAAALGAALAGLGAAQAAALAAYLHRCLLCHAGAHSVPCWGACVAVHASRCMSTWMTLRMPLITIYQYDIEGISRVR